MHELEQPGRRPLFVYLTTPTKQAESLLLVRLMTQQWAACKARFQKVSLQMPSSDVLPATY